MASTAEVFAGRDEVGSSLGSLRTRLEGSTSLPRGVRVGRVDPEGDTTNSSDTKGTQKSSVAALRSRTGGTLGRILAERRLAKGDPLRAGDGGRDVHATCGSSECCERHVCTVEVEQRRRVGREREEETDVMCSRPPAYAPARRRLPRALFTTRDWS